MRLQDDNKRIQIYDATAQLINEIGFNSISMSKIAKLANVSKANLYTYFSNKEEMFTETYIYFKKKMLSSCLNNIIETDTTYTSIMKFCSNLLDFIENNEEQFLFLEQCNSAPQLKHVQNTEIEKLMDTYCELFQKGIDNNVLKDKHPLLLISFCFFTVTQIYKEYQYDSAFLEQLNFDDVFQMSWDAIKR